MRLLRRARAEMLAEKREAVGRPQGPYLTNGQRAERIAALFEGVRERVEQADSRGQPPAQYKHPAESSREAAEFNRRMREIVQWTEANRPDLFERYQRLCEWQRQRFAANRES